MPPPSRKMEVYEALPNAEEILSVTNSRIGTSEYISEKTGMHNRTVNAHLANLKKDGIVHIAKYKRTTRMPAAMWAKGPGKDAPMPDPLPHAIYCRRYRRNVATAIKKAKRGHKYDERYAGKVALALAEDVAARTRINPQNWFSALGL